MKTMKDDYIKYNLYKEYFCKTPKQQDEFLEELADDEC